MTFSDKLKLIRTTYQLTQSEFAKNIGISRANLMNIEKGRVIPTSLLINYISLAYGIDKKWLINDDDLESTEIPSVITDITIDRIMFYYEQLNDEYRTFVLQQIKQLVELQQQVNHKKEEI
ncbi:helix-turn-helix domain-containing protein [Cellulosilyticum sp. WCF-2]|uniref:helix-turn-helix domain-containing protein n=1 Tax=Cellulosilyticum sp. WCF-2 TaxID=2497860 RepID=UPI000F8C6452|nr:helix-turn-helix transcriptional regulator [Cellulosilyticum sp. WCF-2]QEH70028.1 helix-turn-helix transcriptional regulator [Cellulosilyticum sp. WCF-2]